MSKIVRFNFSTTLLWHPASSGDYTPIGPGRKHNVLSEPTKARRPAFVPGPWSVCASQRQAISSFHIASVIHIN